MIELSQVQFEEALPLFAEKQTHHIARSCCLGLVPCRIFADRPENPTAAVVVLQQLGIAFAAGDAMHAPSLLEALRGWHPWYEVNDPPDAWQPMLAAWTKQSHATARYALESNRAMWDATTLRALATPPVDCILAPYTPELMAQAGLAMWSEDQVGAFETVDSFLRDGMGMALLREDQLVAGCTSFCRHADGYEIQVDTHPDFRGKGYATCVSAAFMLETLRRDMTPYWDAANATSLRLAQKLGFAFRQAYVAWLLITPHVDGDAVVAQVVGE